MADENNSDNPNDVNKSRKGRSVRAAREQLDILKRIEQAQQRTLSERDLEQKIQENTQIISDISEGLEEGLGSGDPKLSERLLRAMNTSSQAIARDEARLGHKERTRLMRQGTLMSATMARAFSPSSIRGAVSEIGKSPDIVNGSSSLMDVPYEALEQQKQTHMERMGVLSRTAGLLGKALVMQPNSMATPARQQRLQETIEEKNLITEELAKIDVAQRRQRHLGQDPESRLERLYKGASKAQSILEEENINREYAQDKISLRGAKEGETVTIKRAQVDNELIEQAKKLSNAMKELSAATDDNVKKAKQKEAEAAHENIEKLQDIKRTGGPADEDKIAKYNRLSNLASYAHIAGGVAEELFVSQRMQTMSNQQGFAELENEKYRTYRGALSGDMKSMMMLSQFSSSSAFGKQIFAGKGAAQTAQLTGAALDVAAGQALTTTNLASAIPGAVTGAAGQSVTNAAAGTMQMAQGAANATVTAADMAKSLIGPGGSANTAYLQAERQARATAASVFEVPAFQRQQLYNYSMGMGRAAIGMGAGGEEFLKTTLGDNKVLDKMQALNISPDEMAKMASLGVSGIGSAFTPQNAVDIMTTARGLEKSGFGTREENMQRMGMLAQAGANNPQTALSGVLEAAVGRGFDNSKSMTLLVQHTAEMAKQSGASIAAGMDVSGSISTILAAATDKNLPKEFALERARTVQDALTGAATNTSTDLLGLINTSNISAKTGLSATSAQFAAKLTAADLKGLSQMSEEKAREFLVEKGVDPNEFKGGVKAGVASLRRAQIEQQLLGAEGGGLAFGSKEQRDRIAGYLEKGLKPEQLKGKEFEQDRLLLSRLYAGIGGTETYGGMAAQDAVNETGAKEKINKAKKGEGGGELQKALDDMRTAGAGQLTDAAKEATKQLGSAATALKGFAEIAKQLRKSGFEETATTAAAEAAGSGKPSDKSNEMFNKSVGMFGTHIEKLGEILDKANLSGTATYVAPRPMPTTPLQPKGSRPR